ncbi:MAG: hypothetical protein NT128_07175 [Proteobacteria bacterium]|nr:hypothetical protein [Pseudomonadota bacterium]
MRILVIILFSFNFIFAEPIDQKKLEKIENFLSTMTTLESEMSMDITNGTNSKEEYTGKIWLDRKSQSMRINYGSSSMVAKNGTIRICQENAEPQEYVTDSTPAGLLLKPSISFKEDGIIVKSLTEIDGLWVLSVSYNSPAGPIPVTLYFRAEPVMLLMGWTIQNPNGSITDVHLNPEKTHMSISIDSKIF